MQHISLFSGIGGFDLAAEWMGWDNIASCEINDFGNKVLEYYWPNTYHHRDIHTLTYEILDYELKQKRGAFWRTNDIILTGGFPCQPYSAAGKRLGKEDDRHLWPEMLRIIREIQPTWVVGENVLGLVNWNDGLVFHEVQADLEAEGYEVQPYVLPAASVNAPHRRDRVWFVAYRNDGNGQEKRFQTRGEVNMDGNERAWDASNASKQRCDNGSNNRKERHFQGDINGNATQNQSERSGWERRTGEDGQVGNASNTDSANNKTQSQERILGQKDERWKAKRFINGSTRPGWDDFPTQSPICGRNDGIPNGLVGITFPKWRNESIKAYGNAIVPQVAYQIFKAIEQYNKQLHNCL